MHRFFTEDIKEGIARVTGEDVHHITKVLRLRKGETVEICDCRGTDYTGTILAAGGDEVLFALTDPRPAFGETDLKVTLYQALAKGLKLDLVVQKAVELGTVSIVPVKTERCVAEPGDFEKKRQRFIRIAAEAAKQSRRGLLPAVGELIRLQDIDPGKHDIVFVAYEGERTRSIKDVLRGRTVTSAAVIIGPEGGFEQAEIDMLERKGVISVSLGKSILRTETAGLKAISVLMYEVTE